MISPPEPDDALEQFLSEAEARLSRRLQEACEAEARGVSSESAAEIRRLEDSLLRAAMAAEQVLTVRKQIERSAAEAPAPPDTAEKKPSQPPSMSAAHEQSHSREDSAHVVTTVREFKDCKGRIWRAWPVTPGSARAGQPSRRTLGEFQEGWICFESVDDSARRRLPRREARWSELREEELEGLLDQAITVPGRKHQPPQTQPDSDSRLH